MLFFMNPVILDCCIMQDVCLLAPMATDSRITVYSPSAFNTNILHAAVKNRPRSAR